VREAERLATRAKVKGKRGKAAKEPREKDADTKALERDLSHKLGLKVEIGFDGKGGAVTVHYQTLEQLDEIIGKLGS
jgi:ParB family transcriptional regulator, chromosome partitioning protein